MSDRPCEAQRTMERIFLCNDIWFDCLPWLSRAKVGFEFALVSDRFDGLADAHLNSKKRPWKLGKLMIMREQGKAFVLNWDTEKYLPLPEAPLPKNVIGFKCIFIRYVDQKVIDFLRHLFQQPTKNGDDGIGLKFLISSQVRNLDIFFDSIYPLIDQSAITLANVRVVDVQFGLLLKHEGNGQLLRQWLLTPRKDGKPKLVKHCRLDSNSMEDLKTEFLSAQTAVSFIIAIYCYDGAVPFEVDNLRTGERLAFRKVDSCNWLLERGPIVGRDVKQWAKWEREAMREVKKHNLLTLSLDGNAIGLLDESAGPSGQSQQKRIKLDQK